MSTRMVSIVVSVLLFSLPLFPQTVSLARHDSGGLALVPDDQPVVELTETGGEAGVVVRITAADRAGDTIGAGRVIVLDAFETRILRLCDWLTPAELRGTEIRVEVIQGAGQLHVSSATLQPRSDATSSRRRHAVRHPGRRPSSFGLIDQAEAAGSINSETALLYRVYSLFADARLPSQYQGDDSSVIDSLYLSEVRDRFTSLSEATRDAVQPFLAPPAYKGSWANQIESGDVSTMETPPPCQFFSDSWAWIDSTNGLVRVWYRLDLPDAGRAAALVGRIDATIWPKIAGLMTRLPVSDLGYDCSGSNGRYDIYLSDVPSSTTVAMKACDRGPRPAFTLLKRTSPDALAVHEIFHAFQFAYPLAGCVVDDNYRWWAEASAQWAQDFVIPADRLEQSAAASLLGAPEKPLDYKDKGHEYGAYLLPFYVYRKTGSAAFVNAAWLSSASQPALEALDQALPGGFKAVWPEFAKYNWNQGPVDDYSKWDGLNDRAAPAGGAGALELSANPDFALPLALGLPRLSATYKYFRFDESVRSVAFWNGVTTRLALEDPGHLSGVQYVPNPASEDQARGAHITALIRIAGTWRSEVWTDRPYVTYCRDLTAERIEELVLIISNSDFKTRDRKLEAPGLQPVLFVSNMGCWRWKGTASYKLTALYTNNTISTNVTWTRDGEAGDTVPKIAYKAEGGSEWTISSHPPSPLMSCDAGGSLAIADFFTLTTYNFIPPEGTFRRSYVGAGVETRLIAACGGQTTMPPWLFHPLQPFVAGIPDARFLTVSADGATMDGSYSPSSQPGTTWTWHFVAQKQ